VKIKDSLLKPPPSRSPHPPTQPTPTNSHQLHQPGGLETYQVSNLVEVDVLIARTSRWIRQVEVTWISTPCHPNASRSSPSKGSIFTASFFWRKRWDFGGVSYLGISFLFGGGRQTPKVSSKPCGGVLILKNPQITDQVIQMESSLGKRMDMALGSWQKSKMLFMISRNYLQVQYIFWSSSCCR